MDNCRYKEYCNNDCDKCNIEKIEQAVFDLIKAAFEILSPIVDAFIKIAKEVIKTFGEIYDIYRFCEFPNKRVLHLAMYHRKKRVREKNRKRILKWLNGGNK